MHQIVCRLGFAPDPTGGTYSAPSNPLAVFRMPTSKGSGGEIRGGRGEEWKGRREDGREWRKREGRGEEERGGERREEVRPLP